MIGWRDKAPVVQCLANLATSVRRQREFAPVLIGIIFNRFLLKIINNHLVSHTMPNNQHP
jgi:hypothetical protein